MTCFKQLIALLTKLAHNNQKIHTNI